MNKIAVVCVNMGGPESLEDVKPYLKNIFMDSHIIGAPKLIRYFIANYIAYKRAPKSKRIYEQIGGKSPLKAISEKQAELLEQALNSYVSNSHIENTNSQVAQNSDQSKSIYTVYSAMRYWHNFMEDVFIQIKKEDFNEIIVLPMYPYYSFSTVASIQEEAIRLAKKFKLENLKCIDTWYDNKLYIKAVAAQIAHEIKNSGTKIADIDGLELTKNKLQNLGTKIAKLDNLELTEDKLQRLDHNSNTDLIMAQNPCQYKDILFTPHSVPQSYIEKGDPYQKEILASIELIKQELLDTYNIGGDKLNIHIAYQSKIGPVKWLEPSTISKLKELAHTGLKSLLVYPLGFVADNSETLYEIEMEYAEMAREDGIANFKAIKPLNFNTDFIKCLAEIVCSITAST